MKPCVQQLFDKASNLKDGAVLTTSFGPNHHYDIIKEGDGFLIRETGNYWKRNNVSAQEDFKTALRLETILVMIYPRWYAENAFTGKLTHMDNINNFCASFKEVSKEEFEKLISR
jgi:hypothetical protein